MQVVYMLLIVVAAGAISSWSLRRWPTMDKQRYLAAAVAIVGSLVGILRRNDPSSIGFYVGLFIVASSAGLLLQVWLRDKPRTS